MVITVYVLRTSKRGLLFHCSKFCSRQNRKTCIKCVGEQHWHQGRGKYRQSMEQAWLEWLLWSLAVKELLCCCNHLSICGTLKIVFYRHLWWTSYKSGNGEFPESACVLALHSWSITETAVQKGRKQRQLFQLWEAGCLRIWELIK